MTATICFVIIAHNDAAAVARLAKLLIANEGRVAIHFDLSAPEQEFVKLQEHLGSDAERVIWAKRVRVAWGAWSIVQATLNALEAVAAAGPSPDFVHLLSGSDYPIRPIGEFRDYLQRHASVEHIECVDISVQKWVTDGLSHERYQYRHYFNWKTHPGTFDKCWRLQRTLGLSRRFLPGLRPRMGSQWWTLTWRSVEKALAAGRDPRISSFFRTVWIPDEMYFQSVISGARSEPPTAPIVTLYQFTEGGIPVIYYNDHAEYLSRQPFFFARKLSPHADRLRDDLDKYVSGALAVKDFPDEAFGVRTPEYDDYIADSKKSKVERPLLGFEKDSWRGDLAYQQKPILAIFGASISELRAVGALLNRTGHFVCHGALFDPQAIGFADDAQTCAGYRSDDVAIRDDSPNNFLYAIAADAPEQTIVGFLAPWGMDAQIRARIRWSAFSRVLIVRGSVVRGFLESAAPRQGEDGASLKDIYSASEFRSYCGQYNQYYDTLRKDFSTTDAKVQDIDLSSSRCILDLLAFLQEHALPASELGEDGLSAITRGGLAGELEASAPTVDPAAVRRLIGSVADAGEREALLRTSARDIFGDAGRPLIVLYGASRVEVDLVADVLEHAGVAAKAAATPLGGGSTSDLPATAETALEPQIVVSDAVTCQGTSLAHPWTGNARFAGSLAIWAEDVRVVNVAGNMLRAFNEYRKGGGLRVTKENVAREFKEFLVDHEDYKLRLEDECKDAHADWFDLDLMSRSWLRDLLSYFDATEREEDTRKYVFDRMIGLDDPQDSIDQPAKMVEILTPKERRDKHMSTLRRA